MSFLVADVLIGAFFGYVASTYVRGVASAVTAAAFIAVLELIIISDFGFMPEEGVVDVWLSLVLRAGLSAALFHFLGKKMRAWKQRLLQLPADDPAPL